VSTYSDSLVQVIGINSTDKPDVVKKDAQERGSHYPQLIGRGSSIIRDYKVRMLPYLYVINQKGKIEFGEFFLQFDDFKAELDDLVGTSKKEQ